MKKLISLFLFSAVLFSFVGCKNDLKVSAPYKDITVVYGLLDQNDSVHYIRVNKAFSGNGDAYTMAKQYDSVNYPVGTIAVQIQDLSTNTTYTLNPDSSIPMNSGAFSYPKQILYKTTALLNVNDQYKLIITNVKTGKVATGSTFLLPDVGLMPSGFMNSSAFAASFDSAYPTDIQWTSNAQAIIYQLGFRFFYSEIDSIKNDTVHKYVDWVFPPQTAQNLTGGYQMDQKFTGQQFLQFLKGSISPAVGTIKRIPNNIEVMFTSGSNDLNTYIQLSQPSLTVNQEKPFYTNLVNAVGIFTSRHTVTQLKPIGTQILNAMISDPLTAPINFKRR
jgi:hypothetical protein